MEEYVKIGTCCKVNGDYYFAGGESEQGIIFKDSEAYEKDWDAPCYVPEYGFPDDGRYEGTAEYYTHNNLLALCHNDKTLCDFVFDSVDWQYPETYLEELSYW